LDYIFIAFSILTYCIFLLSFFWVGIISYFPIYNDIDICIWPFINIFGSSSFLVLIFPSVLKRLLKILNVKPLFLTVIVWTDFNIVFWWLVIVIILDLYLVIFNISFSCIKNNDIFKRKTKNENHHTRLFDGKNRFFELNTELVFYTIKQVYEIHKSKSWVEKWLNWESTKTKIFVFQENFD
jgi:hypothetical protein